MAATPKPYDIQSERESVCFGPFALDLIAGELRKDGAGVPLQPQAFQILAALLERPGEVVTREELCRRIWGSATFVDFDHSLAVAVKRLRDVLCDSADKPRYVETVRRRGRAAAGYRFIGEVRDFDKIDKPKTVAVLPFTAYGSEDVDPFFVDGLTEEITTRLAQLAPHRLAVIARTSVSTAMQAKKTAHEIGRKLKADYVLHGTIRQVLGRCYVTTELVKTADQTLAWGHNLEHPFTNGEDWLKTQTDFANRIVAEFASSLLVRQPLCAAERWSNDPRAYEHYLRGRYHHAHDAEPGWPMMRKEYLEAIALDPFFGAPYAGLADIHSCYALYATGLNDEMSSREAAERAYSYAHRACELDTQSAEAHAALGMACMLRDWSWAAAERELKLAVSLNRNCSVAHHWYGWCLVQHACFDAGLAEMRIARSLDPLSLPINGHLGWFLYLARRPQQAVSQLESTLTLAKHPMTLHSLGLAYLQAGRLQDAIASMEECARISMSHGLSLAGLGQIYGAAGELEKALQALRQLESMRDNRIVSPYVLALAAAGCRDRDLCFKYLEQSVLERSAWIPHLNVEPAFDSLREEPRWIALLDRAGLGLVARPAVAS